MNVIKRIDQYNEDYLYFCDPIKNNVMNDGNFIRILYSSPLFILNGIYLNVLLTDVSIEKYYNKYKCIFHIPNHRHIIEQVKNIEIDILKKVNIKDKIPQYKISEQLCNGNIKLYIDDVQGNILYGQNNFLLKISGVWETDTSYGVTFKFIKINHQ